MADIHEGGPAEPIFPTLYVPYDQDAFPTSMSFAVRTAGEPAQRGREIEAAIRHIDPGLVVSTPRPMRVVVARSFAESGFYSRLFTLFAMLALALGAVGIYGIASMAVSSRRREIGLRMALGARPEEVARATLAAVLAPVAVGGLVGILASVAAAQLLEGVLYGVAPGDPTVLLAVVSTLGIVALLAAWAPARRAARIDPARSLAVD